MSCLSRNALQVLVSIVALLAVMLGGCAESGKAPPSNEQETQATVVYLQTQISRSLLQTQAAQKPTGQPTAQSPTQAPATAPAVAPTEPPQATIEPLIFNLSIHDQGDGWKVGTAYLALVNTSERIIRPQAIQLGRTWIETQERKDYDATIFSSSDWPSPGGGYGRSTSTLYFGNTVLPFLSQEQIDSEGLAIPSHLPISMFVRFHDLAERRSYIVQFRFAQAAHPSALKMESSVGVLSTNLPSPVIDGANIIKLYGDELRPTQQISVKSLPDLRSDLSQLNPNIQLEFECTDQGVSYRATNTNQLDEEHLVFPFGMWYSDGVYVTSIANEGSFLSIGPGQTIQGTIQSPRGRPTYLVRYEGDRSYVYDLNCPTSK